MERDSERDRLKRLRRMKKSPDGKREIGFSGLEIQENGQVAVDDEGWEKIPDYLLTEGREARGADARLGDAFDQQWDSEMAAAKLAANDEMSDSSSNDGYVDLGQTVPSASGRHGVPRNAGTPTAPFLPAPETTAPRSLAVPGRNLDGRNSSSGTQSSPPRSNGNSSLTASAYSSPPQQTRSRPAATPVPVPPRGRARISPGHYS